MPQYNTHLNIDGLDLPVNIVFEYRNNTRWAFTRTGLSLRMPHGLPAPEVQKHLRTLQEWAAAHLLKKPSLREKFIGKTYQTGDLLEVGGRKYTLQMQVEARSSHTGKLLDNNIIQLQMAERSTPGNRLKATKTLLSRIVAGDFYPEITRRVRDWNDRTFQQPIKSINLKYNHSNWGSCSARNNVNLSTRLLFAPVEVQDYVILHELAHLVELNHSDRFWALVERHMPDYQVKEKWLKQHGPNCDF